MEEEEADAARGRLAVPRGKLAVVWQPRGMRAMSRSGECAVNGRSAREQERGAEVGRAGLCGWGESEA